MALPGAFLVADGAISSDNHEGLLVDTLVLPIVVVVTLAGTPPALP